MGFQGKQRSSWDRRRRDAGHALDSSEVELSDDRTRLLANSAEKTSMIAIKPHHFVDLITAFGAGQMEFHPHPYGHAVHSVAKELLANRDVDLRIELGADDICGPCRHNHGGVCDDTIDTSFRPEAPTSKGEYNLLIDRRWSERLGLRQDDELTARELCLRLRDCAHQIEDIYRETPSDRTAERQAKLQKGIDWYLKGAQAPIPPET